jgi:hypothetical protein
MIPWPVVKLPSITELSTSVGKYRAMIEKYERAQKMLWERRRGATDHVMVELDDRIIANARMIDALNRVIDVTEKQIQIVRSRSKAG